MAAAAAGPAGAAGAAGATGAGGSISGVDKELSAAPVISMIFVISN